MPSAEHSWQAVRPPLQTKHFQFALRQFASHLWRRAIVFKVTQISICIYPLCYKLFTSYKIHSLSQSYNWTVYILHKLYSVQSCSNFKQQSQSLLAFVKGINTGWTDHQSMYVDTAVLHQLTKSHQSWYVSLLWQFCVQYENSKMETAPKFAVTFGLVVVTNKSLELSNGNLVRALTIHKPTHSEKEYRVWTKHGEDERFRNPRYRNWWLRIKIF